MLLRLKPFYWVLLLVIAICLIAFIKINLDKTSINSQDLAMELKHFDVYKALLVAVVVSGLNILKRAVFQPKPITLKI